MTEHTEVVKIAKETIGKCNEQIKALLRLIISAQQSELCIKGVPASARLSTGTIYDIPNVEVVNTDGGVFGCQLKDCPHELRAHLLEKSKHLLNQQFLNNFITDGWLEPLRPEENDE